MGDSLRIINAPLLMLFSMITGWNRQYLSQAGLQMVMTLGMPLHLGKIGADEVMRIKRGYGIYGRYAKTPDRDTSF